MEAFLSLLASVLLLLGEVAGPAFARARGMDAIFLLRGGDGVRQVIVGRG